MNTKYKKIFLAFDYSEPLKITDSVRYCVDVAYINTQLSNGYEVFCVSSRSITLMLSENAGKRYENETHPGLSKQTKGSYMSKVNEATVYRATYYGEVRSYETYINAARFLLRECNFDNKEANFEHVERLLKTCIKRISVTTIETEF